ncbi:MAG: DUF1549 domain-containing protein [Verrucomicrobia bacterium]|nr:DUF1549 domain-containing protein [Verrucomicrobiota bacterium]NBU09970.1 DUF1549 domain-containing protein [Pseudomonadota bacterium]NDB75791.1 DUF1549 domain-containing protein [Verrucomicrobiota bacterium]
MQLSRPFTRWLLLTTLLVGARVFAAEPLHVQVDQLIAKQAAGKPFAAPATDAEFLRRACLDFTGTIPTAEQTRAFLANQAADKRTKLIEQLFASPKYAERMAEAFNIQLMERNGDNAEWRKFLTESFRANKPWDQLAREIISPDFKDEKLRGAGWFITRRLDKVGQQDTDYPGLTRDVGRLFLGLDLQCCQCHKHLTVKDYKQVDFNGLFFPIQNLKMQAAGGDYKTAWVQEGLVTNKYEFVSVLSSVKGSTGPRVPLGPEIEIPTGTTKDELWAVPPDPKTRKAGVPKFSPLRELAARLTAADNPQFARNLANRVWWQLMGRGLVEPLDLHHSENPASHPELFDLLAKELVEHKFDVQWLVCELAQTQAYARSSVLPTSADQVPEQLFLAAKERPLSAEQLARSFLLAVGEHERVVEGKGWAESDKKKTFKDFEKAFLAAFANDAKEPELTVNPTLKAALFLRNNDQVLWALQPRPGNLIARVAALKEPARMADELFHAILSRPPTTEETAALEKFLTKRAADREKALGHFAWAMLSSMEFFTNH